MTRSNGTSNVKKITLCANAWLLLAACNVGAGLRSTEAQSTEAPSGESSNVLLPESALGTDTGPGGATQDKQVVYEQAMSEGAWLEPLVEELAANPEPTEVPADFRAAAEQKWAQAAKPEASPALEPLSATAEAIDALQAFRAAVAADPSMSVEAKRALKRSLLKP